MKTRLLAFAFLLAGSAVAAVRAQVWHMDAAAYAQFASFGVPVVPGAAEYVAVFVVDDVGAAAGVYDVELVYADAAGVVHQVWQRVEHSAYWQLQGVTVLSAQAVAVDGE